MAHSDNPHEQDEVKHNLVRSSLEQARTSFHAYAEIANRLLIGRGGVVEVFNQKALDLAKHDADVNFTFALRLLELDDLEEITLLHEEHTRKRAQEMARRVAELQLLADQADMHLDLQELAEESSHTTAEEFTEEEVLTEDLPSAGEVSAAAVSALFKGKDSDTAQDVAPAAAGFKDEPVDPVEPSRQAEIVEVVEVETQAVANPPAAAVSAPEDLVEIVRAPEENAAVAEPVTGAEEPSASEAVVEVVTAQEVVFEPVARPEVIVVEEKTVEAAAEAVPVVASEPDPDPDPELEAVPEPEPEPEPELKAEPAAKPTAAPLKVVDEAPAPPQPEEPVERAAPVKKPTVKLMPDSPDEFIEDEIKALAAKIHRAKLVHPNVTSASDEEIARAMAEAEEIDDDMDLGSIRSSNDYMDDMPGLENFVLEEDFDHAETEEISASGETGGGEARSFSDDLAAQLEAVRAMIRG